MARDVTAHQCLLGTTELGFPAMSTRSVLFKNDGRRSPRLGRCGILRAALDGASSSASSLTPSQIMGCQHGTHRRCRGGGAVTRAPGKNERVDLMAQLSAVMWASTSGAETNAFDDTRLELGDGQMIPMGGLCEFDYTLSSNSR